MILINDTPIEPKLNWGCVRIRCSGNNIRGQEIYFIHVLVIKLWYFAILTPKTGHLKTLSRAASLNLGDILIGEILYDNQIIL
jgi:hypothetical protein